MPRMKANIARLKPCSCRGMCGKVAMNAPAQLHEYGLVRGGFLRQFRIGSSRGNDFESGIRNLLSGQIHALLMPVTRIATLGPSLTGVSPSFQQAVEA